MNQPLTFAAARRHRPEQATNLLVPGKTCWRIERARKLSWLVDGEQYFGAVRRAMANARSTIFIVGWDIDSRMKLVPTGANDGWPDALGDFLGALLASRPQLNAYILSWDFALLFALEREWLTELRLTSRMQQRLKFQLDDRHPIGASHHQKLIVVDDSVGFVSGFDLTINRWDTPEHLPGDARRRNPDGTAYAPFHDLGVVVSGRAAGALGELARERWYSATGRQARRLDTVAHGDSWPLPNGADLADVDVAIARTEPRFEDHPGVFEVRDLHLDAIAAAKTSIFAENQYFTSRTIAQALASTLERDAGPDIAIISPSTQSGWLETSTMGVLRARIHGDLVRADRHQRYRVYCPWLDDCAAEAACLNVHSKILIVDDEFLTIGSANLSGRSMGLDTECNLAIEAKGDEQISDAIALLRNRLLAEHLARDERAVAEAVRSKGGLIAGIEALRGPGRSLKPLTAPTEDDWSALVPDHSLLDPEESIDTGRLVEQVVSRSEKRSIAVRSAAVVAVIILLVALALAWRYTPLRELINTEALAGMADAFAESPFAPLIVVAAYVIGGLVVLPVTVMIAVTGIVFGPVLGFVYALVGETLSAIFIYHLGRKLGRATVRRVAGKRINALSRRIAKRGLIAVVVVRMLPIAPFTIINLIAGASHIAFRDFVLGTILGMGPGTLVLVLFVDRIVAAVRTPGPLTFTLLALIAGVALAGALLLRSRLGAREEHG
ncbi:MAG TPA: VTT domain-containing protein [Casimicrobiaceae bacterium]|nr:VTT domain-containing protein [Casimicrobiaceae bacterium]